MRGPLVASQVFMSATELMPCDAPTLVTMVPHWLGGEHAWLPAVYGYVASETTPVLVAKLRDPVGYQPTPQALLVPQSKRWLSARSCSAPAREPLTRSCRAI